MSLPDAYPLQWPEGWERTPEHKRRKSRYNVPEAKARNQLLKSIKLLGGNVAIISTNITLRLDGLPYANQRTPEDPGVAVYWVREGKQEVMACDRWQKPWENMRAIYHAIEGLRAMERAGATQIMERAFQAFQLPAGDSNGKQPRRHWRVVLGFPAHTPTPEETKNRFRERAVKLHPDVGGDIEAFKELEQAYREALGELS
jgi:hypothetical protein